MEFFEQENQCSEIFPKESGLRKYLQKRLDTLQEKLKQDKDAATLVLGAGVSQSVGVPSWEKLLVRLSIMMTTMPLSKNKIYGYNHAIDEYANELYYYAENVFDGTDLLEIGGYLFPSSDLWEPYTSIEKRKKYPELSGKTNVVNVTTTTMVKVALLPKEFQKKGYIDVEQLDSDTTLYRTAQLAARYFTNRNQKNRSVLTYNYDNLLETAVATKTAVSDQSIISIYEDPHRVQISNEQDKELYVYHPHGLVDICNRGKGESKRIILSEDSYYEMEKRAYNWQNLLLSRALQDDLCLFIGFSGNDYNFRRILKGLEDSPELYYSYNEDEIHKFHRYIIVTVDTMVQSILLSYKKAESYREVNDLEKRPMQSMELKQAKEKLESLKRETITGKLKDEELKDFDEVMRQRLFAYLRLKENYWRRKGFLPIWTTISDIPKMLQYLCEDE